MKYVFVILFLLIGTVVCYATGLHLGITILLILGVVLELAFWILAIRRAR